ncbi:MAG: kelch repeat-containing protein [Planctomycetota bacterium]
MLARATFPLLAAASGLLAQNDYNYDKLTAARLGDTLTLQISSAPIIQAALFLVSANAGPTPLALIDPLDPRWLAVGTDLLSLMTFAITSPTGSASYSIALPNDPQINAIVLHWQTVILNLGVPFFGALGNDVVTQTGLPDTGVLAPDALTQARAFAAGLVAADNNGGAHDVLLTGGGTGTLTAATGLATTELWDFRHMDVVPGPNMTSARALHLAVRLPDNRVLLIGGVNAGGGTLATCEIYDPASNSFSATGSMATPRTLHAACLLADGRVMVAGGTSTLQPDAVAAITATLSSVEFWSPATGTWSAGPAIGGPRLAPALTRLGNNQVMVSGGVQPSFLFGVPINAVSTTAVQRWNPGTNTWTNGTNMSQGRAGHHYNQVTLADGRVLMTGGVNVPSLLGATTAAPISGAEVYNYTNNSWATVNMPTARALHSATRLANGRVVVAGGAQGTLLAPTSIANVEVFNPASNSWAPAPNLLAPRGGHVADLMPDGTLILFGGQDASATTNTIETLRF